MRDVNVTTFSKSGGGGDFLPLPKNGLQIFLRRKALVEGAAF